MISIELEAHANRFARAFRLDAKDAAALGEEFAGTRLVTFPSSTVERALTKLVESWRHTQRPYIGHLLDICDQMANRELADQYGDARTDGSRCPACGAVYFYAGFVCHDHAVRPRLRCVCKRFDRDPRWTNSRAREWREDEQEPITRENWRAMAARIAAQATMPPVQTPWQDRRAKVEAYWAEAERLRRAGHEISDAFEPEPTTTGV